MPSDTISPKQMDAACELARQDDAAARARAFQQEHAAGFAKAATVDMPNMRVTVMKGSESVFSDTYSIKAEGDMQEAINDAMTKARKEVDLPPWGWTISMDKP